MSTRLCYMDWLTCLHGLAQHIQPLLPTAPPTVCQGREVPRSRHSMNGPPPPVKELQWFLGFANVSKGKLPSWHGMMKHKQYVPQTLRQRFIQWDHTYVSTRYPGIKRMIMLVQNASLVHHVPCM